MKEFFTTLEVPELNSNYAQNLKDFVQAVNNNFAKVASLPFLKGDSGVSIEVYHERLFDEVDGERIYTDFGKAVIRCIYGTEEFPADEMTVSGVHSYDELRNIETIEVFYDRSQGLKYLTVPFMFHDARKNYLGEVVDGDLCENFIDMSTFVVGGYVVDEETGEKRWDLQQHNFEPKLYYNRTLNKFCWAIGSQKTDIIAQGVEGKAGTSVYAKYCKGVLNDNRTYINITEVLNDGGLGVELDNDTTMVVDGDFVMVEFPVDTNTEGETEGTQNNVSNIDLTFGKVITVGGQRCIPYFENVTVRSLSSNVTLKDLLNRVGQTVDENADTVRGLYVYSRNLQTATQDNVIPRKPHMFWVDEKETAHLGMFGNESATTTNTPVVETEGVLDIDYGKVNTNTLDADLYTHTGKDAKIFSYGDGDSNKLELQQSGEDVGVSESPICFIPNPKVVYKEPSALFNVTAELQTDITNPDDSKGEDGSAKPVTSTKIPSEQQNEFENTLNINTYIPSSTTEVEDDNKPKKNVTMGGVLEFALPNLAVQSGEKLYNTKQFVNTYTKNTDPITVTLQKVELNNNKELTDNTSYGWRYYLDNLLLASPIEENVYAGTTNNVLSIDYNNKTYKANIVISAIQYRVGYNSNEELAFKQGTWLRKKTIGGKDYNGLVLEENYVDWYKVADPQPTSPTTTHYVRFNATNNETYSVDNYVNNNVITLFDHMVTDRNMQIQFPDTPAGFTMETVDGKPRYYEKNEIEWKKRTFKYKTTVTDVIYYIVPMEELNSQETDLFSVIKGKGTTANVADKLVCMKYRLFFKEDKTGNENINTIFYNPLTEPKPLKGSTGLCCEINTQTENDVFELYNGGIQNICFVFPRTSEYLKVIKTSNDNVVFLTIDKTYLHPSKENVEKALGKYNNYIWCSGQIVSTKELKNDALKPYYLVNKECCAPSCGRMLPQTPNQIADTKWVLPLTDKCTVDSSKQYEFYTQKSNNTKLNTLSTNLRDADFQKVSVGDVSLRYILEKDNGWFINDRRIVTESVNTEGITYSKYADDGYPSTNGNNNNNNNGGASTENGNDSQIVTPKN